MQQPPICDRLLPMRARRPWQWDEFKETAARRLPERLYATLNPRGDFVVNIKTYIKMNEPEAVVLLYDHEARTIGVRPSRPEVPNAILVHVRHARYNRVFRGRKFLEKHRIYLERTVQFPTAEIDDEGVLILNLREMVEATHMPKRSGNR
jgi:hypothetical protein